MAKFCVTTIYNSPLQLLVIILVVYSSFLNYTNGNEQVKDGIGTGINGCDFFKGNWVVRDDDDELSYPLYNSTNCPFIEKEFDCIQNGRPDKDYLNYRWHPSACLLPRFEGGDMMLKLKGKRMLFVGDSLSLNQWQSLTCMLHTALPRAPYTLLRNGDLSTFTFPTYNASIMFLRNAFLVDITSETNGRILKLDSIVRSKIWQGMDVLIFDTWHWWLHTGRKQPWDFIEEGGVMYKDMDRLVAYEKSLNTWARWVEYNVDPLKTKLFFQGVSPDHANGMGQPNFKTCAGQIYPLPGPEYPGGPHPAELVLEKALRTVSKPVYLLDITTLSQLRIDGHPSVYGHGGHNDMDCSHWCLPGIPDTWNQLFYATFIQN